MVRKQAEHSVAEGQTELLHQDLKLVTAADQLFGCLDHFCFLHKTVNKAATDFYTRTLLLDYIQKDLEVRQAGASLQANAAPALA